MGERSYSVLHHLAVSTENSARKQANTKLFRSKWLENPIFADWLSEVAGYPEKCYCKVCHTILSAGHSELERHAAGRKHCQLLKEQKEGKLKGSKSNSSNSLPNKTDLGNALRMLQEDDSLFVKKDSTKKMPEPNISIKTHNELSTRSKSIHETSPPTIKKKRTIEDIPIKAAFPEKIDVSKLLRLPESDEDDSYSDDSRLEEPVDINTSQMLRGLLTDADKSEVSKEGKTGAKTASTSTTSTLLEKELEARLVMIEEKRRYNLQIYKIKLLEMETRLKMVEEERKSRIKLAEEERARAEELHQLRTAQLQLQIQRENEFVTDEAFAMEPSPKDSGVAGLGDIPPISSPLL